MEGAEEVSDEVAASVEEVAAVEVMVEGTEVEEEIGAMATITTAAMVGTIVDTTEVEVPISVHQEVMEAVEGEEVVTGHTRSCDQTKTAFGEHQRASFSVSLTAILP